MALSKVFRCQGNKDDYLQISAKSDDSIIIFHNEESGTMASTLISKADAMELVRSIQEHYTNQLLKIGE